MKYKTTKKAVNAGYINRILIPSQSLQSLLDFFDATAYTIRPEGWAANIYQYNNTTAIVAGYAPFGNVKADYKTCKKYDTAAYSIKHIYGANYDLCYKLLSLLLDSFVTEVLK